MTGWFGDPAIIEEVTRTENYDLMDEKYILPVITAAFWSEGDQLIAGESWSLADRHGVHLLHYEFSDAALVLPEYELDWGIEHERIELARELYERRLMTTRLPMVLTADEYARLNTQDEAQRAEVERYLLAVGIALPDAGE